MTDSPIDFAGIADAATRRLAAIAQRAAKIARVVGLTAAGAGVLAYLVGLFAFPSSVRAIWAVLGLLCMAPALAVFVASRRVKRIMVVIPETALELRKLSNDRDIRFALLELVDQDDDHANRTPLVKLGRELNTLRNATSKHREHLMNAWSSITTLTTLPGLIAVGTIGTFVLLVFSAMALILRLLANIG